MTAKTVAAAVEQQQGGPVALIRSNAQMLADVLPERVDARQFLSLAETALYRDPKLMEAAAANPRSLMAALIRCAGLGHTPGTDEFYLIPRRNKGALSVQGIEGYRGIIERMYRSGAVASVTADVVRERDRFEYVPGRHTVPVHEPDWFAGPSGRGDMIGVYAYAQMIGGAMSRVVVLSKDDVLAARAKSDGADSQYSPWNAPDGGVAMWLKTAARRLEPWVPTSAEYRREQLRAAVAAENERRLHEVPTIVQEVDTATGEVLTATPADGDEGGDAA